MIEAVIKKVILNIFENRKFNVEKIILFGSRAKKKHKKDSDCDLLVIVKEELSKEEKMELSYLIRRALAEHFICSDVLLRSKKEIEERKEVVGSIIRIAIKEGSVL